KKKGRAPEPDGVTAEVPPPPKDPPQDSYRPADEDLPPERPKLDIPPPSRLQEQIDRRREVPPPPAHPLINGVWTFPWYRRNLPPWIVISLGFAVLVVIFQTFLSFWPG